MPHRYPLSPSLSPLYLLRTVLPLSTLEHPAWASSLTSGSRFKLDPRWSMYILMLYCISRRGLQHYPMSQFHQFVRVALRCVPMLPDLGIWPRLSRPVLSHSSSSDRKISYASISTEEGAGPLWAVSQPSLFLPLWTGMIEELRFRQGRCSNQW